MSDQGELGEALIGPAHTRHSSYAIANKPIASHSTHRPGQQAKLMMAAFEFWRS